jgi:hypothetical protein
MVDHCVDLIDERVEGVPKGVAIRWERGRNVCSIAYARTRFSPRYLVSQPGSKSSSGSLLAVVLLDHLNRSAHVAGDFEHAYSIAQRIDHIPLKSCYASQNVLSSVYRRDTRVQ